MSLTKRTFTAKVEDVKLDFSGLLKKDSSNSLLPLKKINNNNSSVENRSRRYRADGENVFDHDASEFYTSDVLSPTRKRK